MMGKSHDGEYKESVKTTIRNGVDPSNRKFPYESLWEYLELMQKVNQPNAEYWLILLCTVDALEKSFGQVETETIVRVRSRWYEEIMFMEEEEYSQHGGEEHLSLEVKKDIYRNCVENYANQRIMIHLDLSRKYSLIKNCKNCDINNAWLEISDFRPELKVYFVQVLDLFLDKMIMDKIKSQYKLK